MKKRVPINKIPLEESLKDILAEDEEQTALCFEEWIETASDKTLCQELEGFFETSVALGSLFAQDLENLLKENSGFKKITIQDWLNHMGLGKGDHKVEILSQKVIQFYELFNQALASHIATTLFKDKIPEEDLEKFKAFLLHVKDFTIDGKLTGWQIAGALVGAGVAGVASYALYILLEYNFLDVFFFYNFDIWGTAKIVHPVTRVLIGPVALDASVRNARMSIDFFSPKTTHFTLPMDPKILKALRWKKAGIYTWSAITAFIPAYYYNVAQAWRHKFWGTVPFLCFNSILDSSSRLVSNAEKESQKPFHQKIEENYPRELKAKRTTLLNDLKESDESLKAADQKEINHYYDVVYHSVLSQTKDIKTEDAKFAQTLYLLIFFLELENFEAMESPHEDSNPSSEVIQNPKKEEQKHLLETKEDTIIIFPESSKIEENQSLLMDSNSSSEIINTSENQEEISFFEEKGKKNPLLEPIEIENVQQKKIPTWREKIANGLSWVLPIVGTTLLVVGTQYMWSNIIACTFSNSEGYCWDNKVAVDTLSSVAAVITWGAVSIVQKASIQKNIEEFPGGKPSKTTSQKPVRVGWQLLNYVVSAFLTVPDFMLWANATVKWKAVNALRYIGIGCATAPEVISTADSLNGSTSDFITGTNRVLSHVYASEGFRRDKLREIRHDLSQFIKTLQPGVFKALWTTLHSLQKVLKEGPEKLPPHLKRLFDDNVLKAFAELSQIFKEKKEKYVEERHKEEKKKREEKKRNEEEMKSISNYYVINDDN